MKLTEHFSLAELIASDYATRHGINNMPDDHEVLENLHILADGLERVRRQFILPIYITSGYRSPKLNAAVGGSKTSDHMRGLAADFHLPGVEPIAVCRKLADVKEQIGFCQLIHEGTWTHISFPPANETPAGIVLTAVFKPGKPTTYLQGIV